MDSPSNHQWEDEHQRRWRFDLPRIDLDEDAVADAPADAGAPEDSPAEGEEVSELENPTLFEFEALQAETEQAVEPEAVGGALHADEPKNAAEAPEDPEELKGAHVRKPPRPAHERKVPERPEAAEATEADAPEGTSPSEAPDEAAEEKPEDAKRKRRVTPRVVAHHAGVLTKVVAFLIIGVAILIGISIIATPYWSENLYTDKIRSLQAEPENTIDVLVLGTSSVAEGISPMTMYEDYGVSAYNGGMSKQPIITSYCIAKEVYLRNPESLETIVFDPSGLRTEPDENYYRMIMDGLSIPAKYDAIGDIAEDPLDALGYLFPVFSYHDRWEMYGEDDTAQLSYPLHPFMRGYFASQSIGIKDGWNYRLAAHRYNVDEAAVGTPFDEDQYAAFLKLVEFCEENDLNLVIAKLPTYDWASGEHVAVARVAEEHNLPFLDYNFDPYVSEIEYNQALFTRDNYHLNDEGARRVSSSIAKYLVENGLAEDRRGDERYAFLDDYAKDFNAVTSDLTALRQNEDPVEYLAQATDLANTRDWTIYVGATNEGLQMLTDEQRQRLNDMGYAWLGAQNPIHHWYGVIEDGKIIEEEAEIASGYELQTFTDEGLKILPKTTYFRLAKVDRGSGADVMQGETATLIHTTNWYKAWQGITYVIYDNDYDMVVDVGRYRADMGLHRFETPQAILDGYLAAGTPPWEMPYFSWRLYDYERANEIARRGAEAKAALMDSPPEETA